MDLKAVFKKNVVNSGNLSNIGKNTFTNLGNFVKKDFKVKSIKNELLLSFSMLIFFMLLIFCFFSSNIIKKSLKQINFLNYSNSLVVDRNFFDRQISDRFGTMSIHNNKLSNKNGDSIEGDTHVVDTVSLEVRGVATIFKLDDGNFNRVSTSILNDQ